MTVHFFPESGLAYAACQCDESITKGDLLIIESERVIGVADTWPIAVSREHGALHCLSNGELTEQLINSLPHAVLNGIERGQQAAAAFGW